MRQLSIIEKLTTRPIEISQLAIAVEVLKTYNCRASEVLNARWSDFYPAQMLILQGMKKSSNIIIRDRFILELISRLPKLDEEKIFPSLNYYHLYRYCKQFYSHLFIKFKKKHYYKVTHGFRYRAVEQVANETKIRDILHHRSINSGKYYKLKKGVP